MKKNQSFISRCNGIDLRYHCECGTLVFNSIQADPATEKSVC